MHPGGPLGEYMHIAEQESSKNEFSFRLDFCHFSFSAVRDGLVASGTSEPPIFSFSSCAGIERIDNFTQLGTLFYDENVLLRPRTCGTRKSTWIFYISSAASSGHMSEPSG